MIDIFSRCEMLWGSDFQRSLQSKHVIIIGLGGVGAYALDALARSGVGMFTIVDFDQVSSSNINRQLLALNSTVGQSKAILAKERVLDINPAAEITAIELFYTDEMAKELFNAPCDFVVDAIDTMRSKISLLEYLYNAKIPAISSFGAANRINPEMLKIVDLSLVFEQKCAKKCVFTKNILYQLKKRGITSGIPVVISDEMPQKIEKKLEKNNINGMEFNKIIPASSPFVPPVAGYLMASYIIRSFLDEK